MILSWVFIIETSGVYKIFSAKRGDTNADSREWEREVDNFVYPLYGLNGAENPLHRRGFIIDEQNLFDIIKDDEVHIVKGK